MVRPRVEDVGVALVERAHLRAMLTNAWSVKRLLRASRALCLATAATAAVEEGAEVLAQVEDAVLHVAKYPPDVVEHICRSFFISVATFFYVVAFYRIC